VQFNVLPSGRAQFTVMPRTIVPQSLLMQFNVMLNGRASCLGHFPVQFNVLPSGRAQFKFMPKTIVTQSLLMQFNVLLTGRTQFTVMPRTKVQFNVMLKRTSYSLTSCLGQVPVQFNVLPSGRLCSLTSCLTDELQFNVVSRTREQFNTDSLGEMRVPFEFASPASGWLRPGPFFLVLQSRLLC